jgi:hypothetical protein
MQQAAAWHLVLVVATNITRPPMSALDLLSETPVAFNKLAQERSVALSTVWRWHQRGIRGHRLEGYNQGAKKFTTREAFGRFIARTNGETVRAETPRQVEKRLSAAEKKAEALGV